MPTSPPRLFHNGRVFTASPAYVGRPWADSFVVVGERIAYAGSAATAERIAGADAEAIDLDGALVIPGIVDAHAHVLMTGETAGQADLQGLTDVAEVERRIRAWAAQDPTAPRVRAYGWQHAASPTTGANRQWLDSLVADRPLIVQTGDFHSILLNTAALRELGIDATTRDPAGGEIQRDAAGEPTGYIDETALQQIVWPRLAALGTDADTDRHLAAVLDGYRRHGITTAVDMALGESDLAAMLRAEAPGELTTRIVGHWLVEALEDGVARLAQVERAIELHRRHQGSRLRVTGIKLILDGTVDGCTAAVDKPYANGKNPGPIWDPEMLAPVMAMADAAGLQVAMHAIGDEAVRIAIGAVEHAIAVNGPKHRRHRIEHLEVVDNADLHRLAALGIAASMQPVHADPAVQENWRAMLGDERVDRGFPWPEVTDADARLVFGTDSPTAPFQPLQNMYVAATRRSALVPDLPPNLEKYAVPLTEALVHATRDAAWACHGEAEIGSLSAGCRADFAILDRDVFAGAPEDLLRAEVVATYLDGTEVYAR